MDTNFKILPDRLKKLRKRNKLTQSEIADKIGAKQGTYSRWERGLLSPNPAEITKLVFALNTTSDYLLGNTDIDIPLKLETMHEIPEDTLKKLIKSHIFDLQCALIQYSNDNGGDIDKATYMLIDLLDSDPYEKNILESLANSTKQNLKKAANKPSTNNSKKILH